MLRWIIFIVVIALIELYAFQAVKTVFKYKYASAIYVGITIIVLGNFIYNLVFLDRKIGLNPTVNYAIGFFLTLYVPKLILILILFGEDVYRGAAGVYHYFTKNASSEDIQFIPSRRKFVSQIGLGLAAVPFASLIYGMIIGKYNYRVLSHTLYFDDLPDAFDGYKITQISDIHCGSLEDKEKIEYAIDLINEQKSDAILFTGDLVNNLAQELKPWKDTFSRLKAKDGVFSVLGNHDYGDYVTFDSAEEKAQNLKDLIAIQKEMGFELLLNESRYITKGTDKIAVVGVENWGEGFAQHGDLKKAQSKISKEDFKILMSHDPSHWTSKVLKDEYPYHLTLSGHTHGMQFGIEIPGWIKWSPVKLRYKHWAGMYSQKEQHLHVNRGFGYLAYPGRVGIWPEVTVIELKKKIT